MANKFSDFIHQCVRLEAIYIYLNNVLANVDSIAKVYVEVWVDIFTNGNYRRNEWSKNSFFCLT